MNLAPTDGGLFCDDDEKSTVVLNHSHIEQGLSDNNPGTSWPTPVIGDVQFLDIIGIHVPPEFPCVLITVEARTG